MTESKVLEFLAEQNRPFNCQGVADYLAQYNLRKTAIQKALDALTESQKIVCKEFGKNKIYYPLQEGGEQLSKEDKEQMDKQCLELSSRVSTDAEAIKDLRKSLKEAQGLLSIKEMEEKIEEMTAQVEEQEERLKTLRSAGTLISKKDKEEAEAAFADSFGHWAKRRRIFNEAWSAVSENLEGKERDHFEEIGVDTDEMAGVSHKQLESLVAKRRRL